MELAITFTSGMDLDDFVGDEKTQYAVIRCQSLSITPQVRGKKVDPGADSDNRTDNRF
jgi:hypothetical protein